MEYSAELTAPTKQQFLEMMTWFKSEDALRSWAGPNFTYPFDAASFQTDLNVDSLSSFSLISNEGELVAFGQCYLRVGRCHLGRLVVAPEYRGKGVVSDLMHLLIEFGLHEFEVQESSLFVLTGNRAAIKAYRDYGFECSTYPEEMPINNCIYMIKSH